MTRRRFSFWLGMFLFCLSRQLRADSIDKAAAALMIRSDSKRRSSAKPQRWRPNANHTWQWYERETRIDGKWKRSGVTTPIHRKTGKPHTTQSGYLDENMVPESVREATRTIHKKLARGRAEPSAFRDGQPPSQWLRSLNANEIRLWLKMIRVPGVGVAGMTFHTHLTRDHSFSATRIQGLTGGELAKLHSAAHYGY